VLRQGDLIGQFSFLVDKGFNFEAVALIKTKVYSLDKQFLFEN